MSPRAPLAFSARAFADIGSRDEEKRGGGCRWRRGRPKQGGSAEMGTLWQRALEDLRQNLAVRDFQAWISQVRPVAVGENEITLEVPNLLCRQWIAERFLGAIERALRQSAGETIKVNLTVSANGSRRDNLPALEALRPGEPKPAQAYGLARTDAGQSFDNFVVGASNQVAFAAALAVSRTPGRTYNPLFIHGGVGLGKTHLLNAVAKAMPEHVPNVNLLAIGAADFVTEAVGALRRRQMERFRRRFTSIGALLLDDIQFLAGKERTQEEFFYIFNELCGSGCQIVVTCDKPAREIGEMQGQLRSRFEGGLIVEILPPDRDTVRAIVARKAGAAGISLDEAVLELIAASLDSPTVRELEGIVTKLKAVSVHTGREANCKLAAEVLCSLYRGRRPPLSIERIQQVVSEHFGVEVKEVVAKKRDRRVVLPRQIAMYIARKMLGESFAAIGSRFSGRDHSTTLHAVRVIEDRLGSDPQVRRLVGVLEAKLSGGPQPPA